jgi:hypothetical protein
MLPKEMEHCRVRTHALMTHKRFAEVNGHGGQCNSATRGTTTKAINALFCSQPGGLPARTTKLRFGRNGATSAGGIAALIAVVASAPMSRLPPHVSSSRDRAGMVQYPAWTPKENIRPTLYTALVFVGDENGARGDHLTLRGR